MSTQRHYTVPGPPEPREKWLRLKAVRFPPEGREERASAAVRAIESAVAHYDLDPETIRWIAEDVDVEDI